jgi:catechol 2,3-dioxygenase-like lactoylglutathione lyase family enzyme
MSSVQFTFCLIATVVTDLERSTRFYCDGLGFEQLNTTGTGGPQMRALLETSEDPTITARYLRKDGVTLELVYFENPQVADSNGAYRPISLAGGPSHIAINVDDIDAALDIIREHGGQVLEHTRASFDMGDKPPIQMILCTDPDGVRIELLSMDESLRRQLVGLPPAD